MYKILFIFCTFMLVQECLGMHSFLSSKTKGQTPLLFILKKGEYYFPQKFHPITPEQRETNNDGEKLTLFCPVETNQKENFDEYCLIPLEDTVFSCKQQVKPVLVKSKELKIRCGIDGESVYYDFVFRLCTPNENAEHDDVSDKISSMQAVDHLMYRICYNSKTNETIFTFHHIVSPNLLKEEFFQNKHKITYDLDDNDYELPKEAFKKIKKAFSHQKRPFLKKFKKNEEIFNNIKELLMVSPDHMAYSLWKIPVYHFINVKPAWDFTIKQWNAINSFFIDTIQDTEFIQINGTKDVWELNGEPVYLDDSQTITIPKYLWKLVYIPAKKALSLVILHNIPNHEFKLEKLCEGQKPTNIHISTSTTTSYVYYCDPKMIIDLYNLPNELDMLQKTEYFSPLVMSYSEETYSFPQTFHGLHSSLESSNQVLFCPALMADTETYDKECLIRNENENPYCMIPVQPSSVVESQSLHPTCGMDLESASKISSLGYRLCFKTDQTTNVENKNLKIEKYDVLIANMCLAKGNKITMHRLLSPQLLFNKNLDDERSIDYLSKDSFTKTDLKDYYIQTTIYAEEEKYISTDGKILTVFPLISPNDMAFSAWKKITYDSFGFEYIWYEIKKIWGIINRQIQIQAADENQEFIQINGTRESKGIKDLKPEFTHSLFQYYWKVVYTSDMKKSVAIIVHNQKNITNIGEKLCEKSTCNMSQWNFGSLSSLEDFAYCCDTKVISQEFHLPQASAELEIKNYHLPLIIKKDENDEFHYADTYQGLYNLEENQILFCPAETNEQFKYDGHQLFPIDKQVPYCKSPLKPFIIAHGSYSNNCGGDEDAHEYTFNYKIYVKDLSGKTKKVVVYLEVYHACFNRSKSETLYTFHKISSTALLRNPKLQHERQMSFKLSNTISNLTLFEFATLEKNLYTKSYKFPNSESRYYLVPLFLISPDDMGFAVHRKLTYHYINVKPSFENVVELWNSINVHITNLAMNETSAYEQRNGFMDYLKINGKKVTLSDRATSLPNVFWKIIYSLDQLGFKDIAIIVHNVPDQKYISRKYCEENICKNKPRLDFLASNNDMVYCCDAAEVKKIYNFE